MTRPTFDARLAAAQKCKLMLMLGASGYCPHISTSHLQPMARPCIYLIIRGCCRAPEECPETVDDLIWRCMAETHERPTTRELVTLLTELVTPYSV